MLHSNENLAIIDNRGIALLDLGLTFFAMNKTIQLSAIFTATILVAGLIAVGFSNDVLAAKPNPQVKPFDCSSSGTFDGEAGTFSQTGNCSHMGKTTFSGTFVPTGVFPVVDGAFCANIASTGSVLTAANGDTVILNVAGTQCFFDANGDAVDVGAAFCGVAVTSTVDGTYNITGGDGRFTDATGSGDISSNANHCTDTFDSTISGTIEYAASN